jgi:uncharacterized BrkB/YihY/UPF0761 family membrane protein
MLILSIILIVWIVLNAVLLLTTEYNPHNDHKTIGIYRILEYVFFFPLVTIVFMMGYIFIPCIKKVRKYCNYKKIKS